MVDLRSQSNGLINKVGEELDPNNGLNDTSD